MQSTDEILSAACDILCSTAEIKRTKIEIHAGKNMILATTPSYSMGGIVHRPTKVEKIEESFRTVEVRDLPTLIPPNRGNSAEKHMQRAIGVAIMNLLSASQIDWKTGDPMAGLAENVEEVGMVGLFAPTLHRFSDSTIRVVERTESKRKKIPDERSHVQAYSPSEADEAFCGVDIVFITGSTCVYGGLGQYLSEISRQSTVVLVGPTSSFIPSPMFDAGVDIVAGSVVTDPEAIAAEIDNDVCATDFYGEALQKVYVENNDKVG